MDDFFDNIFQNKEDVAPSDNDISGQQSTSENVQEPSFTPVSEESNTPYQGTQYQQPYTPGGSTYNPTYGQPYNTQNGNNGGFPPYSSSYQQPQQPQQPHHSTSTNFYTPKKRKKKRSFGKVLFVALICISIIVSSIAIGSDLKDKDFDSGNKNNNNNILTPNTTNQAQESENLGAKPQIQDSPISYSEYTGKGTMTSEQIYKAVKEINVGILVYAKNQKVGEGSGIVVGTDSTNKYTYILTAAHVISDDGVNVQVQFSDESEYEATIVGFDVKTDVGVLKIEATGFKAATFGNSNNLAVGQKVYAIGNPGGTEFFGSFTSGMISAIDRPVPTSNSTYDLPCIQHNAAINPGNSGGALVNEYGQVIGLNSSKISSTEYEGMGFSVPSETVLTVYNELIKHGYVSDRPMLGITYFPVSSDYTYSAIAWKSNLPFGSIVIATINENSDLANKNIQVGDIITAVNGKDLDSTDILLEAIENGKVGDKLKLKVYRLNNNGTISTSFDVTVMLVEDKGNNTVTQPETETDPFSNYFPDFGY